jgi:predicted outer membrane protein
MRATTSLLAGLAILLGASAPGLGAGNTGAAPPDPATFVETAAQDGLTEMKLGALAQQKGKSADVRAFGARMVTDHGKANEELQAIAKPKGLKVPAALDAKHRAMVEELIRNGFRCCLCEAHEPGPCEGRRPFLAGE